MNLVRGVQHDRDDEDLGDVLDAGAKEPSPLGPAREEGSQEERLSFPDVPQTGSDREDRHHGRHHDEPKVQRSARPPQQLLDSARFRFPELQSIGLLLLTKSGDRVAVRRIQPVLPNQLKQIITLQ